MTDTLSSIKSDNVSAPAAPAPTMHVDDPPTEHISEQDKHVLDLMIMQHKLSVANAEKALAENKASESNYKLGLYQLYIKYGMNIETDAIDEHGAIKRNSVGAKKA